jgi:hypothetical protein
MRSDQEILDRIKQIKESGHDWLGFEQSFLIIYLPFELAKPYLVEGTTPDQWEDVPRDRDAVLAKMLDYMPFAWEKAVNRRGVSAGRSMNHYSAWVWLAGDDLGNLNEYEFYGKDNLVKICEHYGWDPTRWDDGVRVN